MILDFETTLNAIPDPVITLDAHNQIMFVNAAAETFFTIGASHLRRYRIDDLVQFDSPLLDIIQQVRSQGYTVTEYDIDISNPRFGSKVVGVQIAPVVEGTGDLVLILQERGIAHKIDRQLTHRNAARSVTGMAAILAHEIKNPLSGIKGAAQLIEENANEEDRVLTRLICDETERICAIVDRMDAFSEHGRIERKAVNIFEVLDHVRNVARYGFAKEVTFLEQFDPSLPPVLGDRDQLIQVFLNLVKNAAEAVPEKAGEITLAAAFRQGVRLASPSSKDSLLLPLEICVIDNGPGVPEELQSCLFDPFVTTKASGTGLGLALVAKLIGDHGGMVECARENGRTVFRVLLPAASQAQEVEGTYG